MLANFRSRQFASFIITGGIAAAVNFFSRMVYNIWLDFSSAIILAYLTGMFTAFVLAKCWVFTNSQQSLQRSIVFFVLVNVFAILQTWLVSLGLAYYVLPWLGVTRWVPEIAHAIGVVVPVFSSYLGHKYFSFREIKP